MKFRENIYKLYICIKNAQIIGVNFFHPGRKN